MSAFGVDVPHHFHQAAHAGDQAHDFVQRAQAADLTELLAEVVQREFAAAEAFLLLGHLVLVELLLHCSTSVSTSPMPRIRLAMRSG